MREASRSSSSTKRDMANYQDLSVTLVHGPRHLSHFRRGVAEVKNTVARSFTYDANRRFPVIRYTVFFVSRGTIWSQSQPSVCSLCLPQDVCFSRDPTPSYILLGGIGEAAASARRDTQTLVFRGTKLQGHPSLLRRHSVVLSKQMGYFFP